MGVAEEAEFLTYLKSNRAAVRYWGVIGLTARKELSQTAREKLLIALGDASPAVRIEAAGALAKHNAADFALPVLIRSLQDENLNVVLHAARTIELLGEKAQSAAPAMRNLAARSEKIRPSNTPATFILTPEQDLAMFCSFSASSFLFRVARSEE